MSETLIYHNPRCSKSRQTLQLLQDKGIEPTVILYLETPPTAEQLADLQEKLGVPVRDMMRSGETEYKDNNLADKSLDDASLLAAMAKYPRLIQRPVVVVGKRAAIGRPPENVLELF